MKPIKNPPFLDPERLYYPSAIAGEIGLSANEINAMKKRGCPFYGLKTTIAWVRLFVAREQQAQIAGVVAKRNRNIPKAIRLQVLSRDGYCCHYCGSVADISLDHKFPFARGGRHTAENLVAACLDCNIKKGVRGYNEFRASIRSCDYPQRKVGVSGRSPEPTWSELVRAMSKIQFPSLHFA